MVKDVIYITKSTTYRELREILHFAPSLKSFPVVTDRSLLLFWNSFGILNCFLRNNLLKSFSVIIACTAITEGLKSYLSGLILLQDSYLH